MRPGPSPFVLLRARRAILNASSFGRQYGSRKYSTDARDPFAVPPLSARLKSIVPFMFWWSAITTLAVHRLRMRIQSQEEMGIANAQISVMESLVERVKRGEVISDDEVRKEMEMVGLRERTALTEGLAGAMERTKDVTWGEALLGRKVKPVEGEAEVDQNKEIDWAEGE